MNAAVRAPWENKREVVIVQLEESVERSQVTLRSANSRTELEFETPNRRVEVDSRDQMTTYRARSDTRST